VFLAGVALWLWTTCGWPEVYRTSLYWVWLTQTLTLLLVVPVVVQAGYPVQLARATSGGAGRLERVLRSGPAKFFASPLVGPALVPVLCGVLFFGPVPTWAVQNASTAWTLQVGVVVVGAFVTLPLVSPIEQPSSLAVGLSLAVGSLELVLDAIPGIALRLHVSLVTSYWDHRIARPWSPTPLHDQHIAGAILWCVSEVLDLPFLLLVFRRWLQADARDAAQIDAVLEAERAARAALSEREAAAPTEPERDAPWWLDDPAMRNRFGGDLR
jgi:cytochrome c oxidase assembly factor CtaG